MTEIPILALPHFSKSFIIETDASRTSLGAVLTQGEGPIAYFSQVLSDRARLKSVYERKLMAIVWQSKSGGIIFWVGDLWFALIKGVYDFCWSNGWCMTIINGGCLSCSGMISRFNTTSFREQGS